MVETLKGSCYNERSGGDLIVDTQNSYSYMACAHFGKQDDGTLLVLVNGVASNVDHGQRRKEIFDKLSEINSWEDWHEFEEKYFNESVLVEKSHEEFAENLNRDNKIIDGVAWYATSCNYRNLSLYFLYRKMSLLVFEKLEPEAAADNATHLEWYGKICYRCERWARSYEPDTCPVCNGELLLFTLNEDE